MFCVAGTRSYRAMSEKSKLLKRTSSNGYGAVSSKNVPEDLLPLSRYGVLWRWAYFVDLASSKVTTPPPFSLFRRLAEVDVCLPVRCSTAKTCFLEIRLYLRCSYRLWDRGVLDAFLASLLSSERVFWKRCPCIEVGPKAGGRPFI